MSLEVGLKPNACSTVLSSVVVMVPAVRQRICHGQALGRSFHSPSPSLSNILKFSSSRAISPSPNSEGGVNPLGMKLF